MTKKQIRQAFRDAVFARDGFRCVVCDATGVKLEVHHIRSRKEMPAGGYVASNGVSLCPDCHWNAEAWLREPGSVSGRFSPSTLHTLIGTDPVEAETDSLALEQQLARGNA